jgi:hypothetical protein
MHSILWNFLQILARREDQSKTYLQYVVEDRSPKLKSGENNQNEPPIAQLVEQGPFKPGVVGSNPTRRTTPHFISSK